MSTTPDGRRDLAAMAVPLARALVAAEEPILRAHGISMWGYIVLTALAEQPVRTQAALAQAIGADKSRIIADLDELQERGLIQRQADPAARARPHPPPPLLPPPPAGRPAPPLGAARNPPPGGADPGPAAARGPP